MESNRCIFESGLMLMNLNDTNLELVVVISKINTINVIDIDSTMTRLNLWLEGQDIPIQINALKETARVILRNLEAELKRINK